MIALKEWYPVVRAMGQSQAKATCLFRKGGILDSGPFLERKRLDEKLMVFFPTSFHASADLLKEEYAGFVTDDVDFKTDLVVIPVEYAFRITGAWHVYDTEDGIGDALDDFHVYRPEFFATRLPWKPEVPLSVVEVQTFQLQSPLMIANEDRLWGCFSWLDLPEGYSITEEDDDVLLSPAISPDALMEKQRALREILGAYGDRSSIRTVIDRFDAEIGAS
mmetsp:Transcript_2750/g.5601  ORF Transcript_2750/g.5601 Transcript_2750/m.5601 type:complete len:220 (-) Transcript_2750:1306-1965(-)